MTIEGQIQHCNICGEFIDIFTEQYIFNDDEEFYHQTCFEEIN